MILRFDHELVSIGHCPMKWSAIHDYGRCRERWRETRKWFNWTVYFMNYIKFLCVCVAFEESQFFLWLLSLNHVWLRLNVLSAVFIYVCLLNLKFDGVPANHSLPTITAYSLRVEVLHFFLPFFFLQRWKKVFQKMCFFFACLHWNVLKTHIYTVRWPSYRASIMDKITCGDVNRQWEYKLKMTEWIWRPAVYLSEFSLVLQFLFGPKTTFSIIPSVCRLALQHKHII